jgi:hypothetical protein
MASRNIFASDLETISLRELGVPLEPAVRLVRALKQTGRRRIPLDLLRREFASACPELAEQPDRRVRLAEVLQNAADLGDLQFPRQQRNWDAAGGAPLPGFVTLTVAMPQRLPVLAPSYAWHPLLAFAATERNRSRLETAKHINEWLKSDPDLTLVVPIKERSLEIFEDEKRLDQLRAGTTNLFGQLSLTALGCRICPVPMPFEAGPASAAGNPILIVENNDTWASFSDWNKTTGRYSAVAYAGGGHGKSLGYDETFIDELVCRFRANGLYYFGDLDPAGLRIASRAAERRARRQSMPLEPASAFYAWLLEHGTRRALERSERVSSTDIDWLPENLHDAVAKLFAAKQRIPQEALGTKALKANVLFEDKRPSNDR